ncbi:MAG: YicC/YloC family endoribonuclease [Candidatus Neomarinimicrobiota bacterium]
MVRSMTGYGQGQVTRGGVTLSVDIQCLNSRFFDLTPRLPKVMQKFEPQVRQEVQQALSRGKVNVTVVLDIAEETEAPIQVNRARLRQYQQVFKQIQEELALTESPSLSHYTAMHDVITVEEFDREDLLLELLLEALREALAKVEEMRAAEGTNLAADLRSRLAQVWEDVRLIENLARERRAGDLERYRSRLQELMDSVPVDEGQLLQEAAVLSEKRDITEECTRLNSHLDLFQAYVEDDEDTGKRLGFLLQEIGREVNTLGAKTDHIDISHLVVRIKDELEKIREQVQNII